ETQSQDWVFCFLKTLKARFNYRLSSVPVFIFYDFQSSNASRRSLYLSLFAFIQRVYSINSLVELIHQSLYTLFDWGKIGK
ncbi:hypothetical protein ACPFUQ_002277, partial [Vibrio cholerae]